LDKVRAVLYDHSSSAMFYDFSLQHENGVFTDIGGKIGNTLKVFSNTMYMNAVTDDGRVGRHEGNQLPQDLISEST
jgi:hypothetical protein